MKKYSNLISLALVAVFVLTAAPALAETVSPSPSVSGTPKNRIQEIRTNIKEQKTELKDKRVELKDKLSENRKHRTKNFWEKMTKRLTNIIRNERRLADKIDERLNRMAANGKDVTQLKADLANARTLITQGETVLNDASGQIESILAGNDAKEAFEKVRQLQKDVLEKIRSAHRSLVDLIKATRQANGIASPSPSVTP